MASVVMGVMMAAMMVAFFAGGHRFMHNMSRSEQHAHQAAADTTYTAHSHSCPMHRGMMMSAPSDSARCTTDAKAHTDSLHARQVRDHSTHEMMHPDNFER